MKVWVIYYDGFDGCPPVYEHKVYATEELANKRFYDIPEKARVEYYVSYVVLVNEG